MLKSGDVFAGFTIERLLGQGGMGSVYLARHPRLDRLTALKLLQPDLLADVSVRTRFEREADLAARLDHPSIVAVYDRGTEDEQAWICMQYIDGTDAGTVDPLQVPPERAAQIIEGVAPALDYAHSMGVLHRDVKPANILLAKSGGGHGEGVFLTDFGLARLRAETTRLTQTGMFTATLAFASPEQMTGVDIDHRSDQYSLGCALYWLLTGVAPFESPNPADIVHGNLQLAPPPLSVHRLGLPAALDTVIRIAMAKQPAHRFGSCTEFAAAVRSAFTNPSAVPGGRGPGIAAPGPYPGAPQPAPTVEPVPRRVSLEKPVVQPGVTQQAAAKSTQLPADPDPPDPNAVTEPVGTPIAQAPPAGGVPAAGTPVQRYFPPAYLVPKKTSNLPVLIALLISLLVLIFGAGIVFVVLAFVFGGDDEDNETVDAGSPPVDTVAAFPDLLPRDGVDTGPGYQNAACSRSDSVAPENFGDIEIELLHSHQLQSAWECRRTVFDQNHMSYSILTYATPGAAQAVVDGLPPHEHAEADNNGARHTEHWWSEPQPSGANATTNLVVSFDDRAGGNALIFVSYSGADAAADGKSMHSEEALLRWWVEVPL